jgi:hypothetical protein
LQPFLLLVDACLHLLVSNQLLIDFDLDFDIDLDYNQMIWNSRHVVIPHTVELNSRYREFTHHVAAQVSITRIIFQSLTMLKAARY